MKEILKNIRRDRIKQAIGISIPTILFLLIPIYVVYLFLQEETHDGSDYLMLGFVLLLAILPIIGIVALIKDVYIAINPLREPVFRKYGSPKVIKGILDEIEKTKIYSDDRIVISKNYVYDGKNFATLVARKDILRVHKIVKRVNGVIDYYEVAITDKYNEMFRYKFYKSELELADEIMLYLGVTNEKTKLGWSQETMNYVHENKEKLPSEIKDAEDNKANNVAKKDKNVDLGNKKRVKSTESSIDRKYSDLKKLKELLDEGIITKKEFDEEKSKIMEK